MADTVALIELQSARTSSWPLQEAGCGRNFKLRPYQKSRGSGLTRPRGIGTHGFHNSSSQVSPIRSWPKLRCGSVATSLNPAS